MELRRQQPTCDYVVSKDIVVWESKSNLTGLARVPIIQTKEKMCGYSLIPSYRTDSQPARYYNASPFRLVERLSSQRLCFAPKVYRNLKPAECGAEA